MKDKQSPMTGGGISPYSSNEAMSSCAGCTRAESEVKGLLDNISTEFLNNPSRFLGLELPSTSSVFIDSSQLFYRWAEKFDRNYNPNSPPLCPDLKGRIKDHVAKLLSERSICSSVAPAAGSIKRKCAEKELSDFLTSLKAIAACPYGDQTREEREWTLSILNARKALFLKTTDISNMEELPYLKKRRTHKFLHSTCRAAANISSEISQSELSAGMGSHMQHQPIRRSQRTLLNIGKSEIHRKRVPTGCFFQADVPVWTGPLDEKEGSHGNTELNDSKWMGTQIWPLADDNRQNSEGMIGKGRSDTCLCTSPGSVDCIKSHVGRARLHLKYELGPAFSSLGFEDMGEEVSRLWTHEEQLMFDDLVRYNPPSEGMSFWEPALECFISKTRQDIVSFYFNVFVLRWMGIRTRLASERADIDADANLGWDWT